MRDQFCELENLHNSKYQDPIIGVYKEKYMEYMDIFE